MSSSHDAPGCYGSTRVEPRDQINSTLLLSLPMPVFHGMLANVLGRKEVQSKAIDVADSTDVLVRVIGSMTEFRQIIGRGTRVREGKGELCFNILDYTGSATEIAAKFGGADKLEEAVSELQKQLCAA